MSDRELAFRVILVGRSMVGKTSLMVRACYDRFDIMAESATIGAENFQKVIEIDDREVLLEIWDTAGQERFRSLVPLYYRRAVGAFFVYDVTCRDSYGEAISWVQELRERVPTLSVMYLVGNKIDLTVDGPRRAVPTSEAQHYAEQRNLLFIETSAKSGTNVTEMLNALACELLHKHDEIKRFQEHNRKIEEWRMNGGAEDKEDKKMCCK